MNISNIYLNYQNIWLHMFIYTEYYTESHSHTKNTNLYHENTPNTPNYIFGNTYKEHFRKPNILTTRNLMFVFMVLITCY